MKLFKPLCAGVLPDFDADKIERLMKVRFESARKNPVSKHGLRTRLERWCRFLRVLFLLFVLLLVYQSVLHDDALTSICLMASGQMQTHFVPECKRDSLFVFQVVSSLV